MTRSTLVLLLALAGCQVDLRPEPLVELTAPRDEARGRELLEGAVRALAGEAPTPWREQAGVEVRVEDAFEGLVGSLACPWPEDPQHLMFRFVPCGDRGVVTLDTEDGPVRWGIHEWNTWRQDGEDPPEYVEDEDIAFWLPTLAYFLEMPFRLPEAAIVDYGGEAELDGEPCHLVYATWVSYLPNDEADQYLAFISQESGRLLRADFTVRDIAGFLEGRVVYADFQEVGGYLLPHTIRIGPEPPDDLLHTYRIEGWTPGIELAREEYAPDPGRPPASKPGS